MEKKILEIKNFSKTYAGNKRAVDHLSLDVCAGDIYGFIGQNGAGKTTTLRAAMGILQFEEGDILIDGHSVLKAPVLCKSISAYIPDNPDLYDFLTGVQYLNYISDVFRVGQEQRTERIVKYADMFRIRDELGKLISS